MQLDLSGETRQPLYLRLTEQWREQMARGVLKPGDRLPSFAELREDYGLHKNTVERAHLLLEQEGLVVREKGRGIFVAAPRAGRSARRSKPTRKGLIGFCGMDFMLSSTSPYWARVLEGIHEVLQREKLQLLLLDSEAPEVEQKVDGALINGSWAMPPRRWHDERWPSVCLFNPSRSAELSCVVTDEYSGIRQAVQHLVELGHRRIAYLFNSAHRNLTPSRLSAYRDALASAGIEVEKSWMRPLNDTPAVGFRRTGYESMRLWLEENWRELGCTALLTHNDESAVGAIEALNEGGLSVPEDVSLVGFDGTELCEYSRPRLTTVEVPLRELGRTGAEMLMQQINEGSDHFDYVCLPTRLRIQESTAPPR